MTIRLAHYGRFIFAGTSVCDDPGKYKKKNLKTNCVISRLMSVLFPFQA